MPPSLGQVFEHCFCPLLPLNVRFLGTFAGLILTVQLSTPIKARKAWVFWEQSIDLGQDENAGGIGLATESVKV